MPERLLHYIWLQRLWETMPQHTTDGKALEIIDPGEHNMDAGPDFLGAKIRIDGMLWVGNVEIHVYASDWKRHQHDTDPAYDSVILHIVKQADKPAFNTRGEEIPTCELKYPHDQVKLEQILIDRLAACSDYLREQPKLVRQQWREFLLKERLQKKAEVIQQLLNLSHNDWEEAFYITLAHNFGFHTNGVPFEQLAKQTPLPFIKKHRDNLFQIEAMLFGNSGLLNPATANDQYSKSLLNEYAFLQKKFDLQPIEASLWKLLRMRPQNFPHIRISQFARLLNSSDMLLSKVLNESEYDQLDQLFLVETTDYWQTHYRFGAESPKTLKKMGKDARLTLIINTVAPYQYAYAESTGNKQLMQKAIRLLHNMPAENNHLIKQWKTLGLQIKTAADSQAFIQLHQNYCTRNRCMNCDIGYQIFTVKNENDE